MWESNMDKKEVTKLNNDKPHSVDMKGLSSSTLSIHVPFELKSTRMELKAFIDAMIYKLTMNAHKGKWEDVDLEETVRKLKQETVELTNAIKTGNVIDIQLESADVANFAMIAAAIALRDAAK